MPAHNESLVIEETLEKLMPQISKEARVIVIADNCTDDTVNKASAYDVEVIERINDSLRGKGYALDYGIRYLEANPPEIVIVLDADCFVTKGKLQVLADFANDYGKPVQSLYLMKNKSDLLSIKQKISEFAFFIKNKIRPLGLNKLSLPCQLMGTGMAFPWLLIKNADIANGNIVEDMKLGVDFVIEQNAPIYLPNIEITSYFPETEKGLQSQRNRWEHGHLDTIKAFCPILLKKSIKNRTVAPLLFALDLAIPPLTLLVISIISFLLLTSFISVFTAHWLIPITVMFAIALMVFSLFITWFAKARHILSLKDILSIPSYVFSKLQIYTGYIKNKEVNWVRTDRDNKK
jgi:cellulose synthase/poly-beta-1,6-N-acetylglucosamine synthase-like glycosyltransferase